ncbi:MAG: hypothetical protein GQF41_4355 [Candidatus Rifleibacterium amylolyticum]|nr:MAG: hypothetical protein GQF41_4355 [Candidatus Rifleibacterium amylolyticum]
MKSRFLVLFICLLATVSMIGCDFFDSDDGDSVVTSTGTVQGYVKAAVDGTIIANATVTTSAGTATTDANGYFTVTAPAGRAKLTAKATGKITTSVFIDVSGTVAANINMRNSADMATVDLTNADTADKTVTNTRAANNATVEFPAGSIVDANGNAVEKAKVEIANSVTSDAGYANAFPGYFLGSTDGAAAEPIESFGYLDVNLYAEDGVTPLKLGAGKVATITIPVNPDPGLGVTTIPLWRLDETTGVWENKGTAKRVGVTNFFEASVTTFSTYNLDKPLTTTIPLTVTVYDGTPVEGHHAPLEGEATTPSTPVVGAEVRVNITDTTTGLTANSTWQGRGVTDANGQLKFTAVPPGNLSVTATKGTKEYTAWSYDVDSASASTSLYYWGEE